MGKRSKVRSSNDDCDVKKKKLKINSRKEQLILDPNKFTTEDKEINVEFSNESLIITDRQFKKKKRKGRKQHTEEFVLGDTDILATPAETEEEINVKETGGNKSKKKKLKTKKHQTEDSNVTVEFNTETEEKVGNVQVLNKLGDASYKSTKTIFIDDKPYEATANSGNIKSTTKKKNKGRLNDDEAEVKDEDIDKFCDELDDEDNVHFENWVKLIEAKMHKKS